MLYHAVPSSEKLRTELQPPLPTPPPLHLIAGPRSITSRDLFLAWLLAFTESFASCQCLRLSVRLTSNANEFVNAIKATRQTWNEGHTYTNPPTYAITSRMRTAISPGFSLFIGPAAMPCWLVLIRGKQLSMAATSRVIWLCACMRYWPVCVPPALSLPFKNHARKKLLMAAGYIF